jgi:hypothetical protein
MRNSDKTVIFYFVKMKYKFFFEKNTDHWNSGGTREEDEDEKKFGRDEVQRQGREKCGD